MFMFKVHTNLFHYTFFIHMRLKPNMEIWLSTSSCSRKLFSPGLLTAVVSHRGKEPMDTEGSRLFAFTLLPFLSNPQKIHFGTSPTKTFVPHGAHKEEVQEQLLLQPPFPLRHVYFTHSPRLWAVKHSQKATQNSCFSLSFMGKRSVLKVPFFVHSPGDPCVSPLVLAFKRRCQVIKLNKTSVTKKFSSGDQKSQLHLIPGTTWQHLKLRTKGKGANFRNHWRWLQIWIVYQRKCQFYTAGRTEVMFIKLFQFFHPQVP